MLSAHLLADPVVPFQTAPVLPVRGRKPVARLRPSLGLVETGTWGNRAAKQLNMPSAPCVSVITRQKAQLAVTRLRGHAALPERTRPYRAEQAFIVQLHLNEVSRTELWLEGHPVAADEKPQEGSAAVLDLAKAPAIHLGAAFDVLQFYVPRAALDEFADDHHARRCDTLRWPFGKVDQGLRNLALCLLPMLEERVEADAHYAEHIVFAMHAYVARNYGGITSVPAAVRGGLAPWQLQRATEMMKARLDTQIALRDVAMECKLSVSHFVRAFKQTVGLPPYQWLLQQRMEAAKELLLHSALPMAEIALECGFADQACFIRAFRKLLNVTPGEWRRARLQ
jgi:AraC family transcriptional regulator